MKRATEKLNQAVFCFSLPCMYIMFAIRRRFSALQTSLHSAWALASPHMLNCRKPNTLLTQALGSSKIWASGFGSPNLYLKRDFFCGLLESSGGASSSLRLRAKTADDTSDERGDQTASDLLGHDSIKTTQRHYLQRGKIVAPTR